MDFDEEEFREDIDELVSKDDIKIYEDIKMYPPNIYQQLITFSEYLKNSRNRDQYIRNFSQLENLSNMNMYMLYLSIIYFENFNIFKPNPNIPETFLDNFLQDGDKYTEILLKSGVKEIDKKNTPEFRFNVKIGLASYLKLLNNFINPT